jgi:hypothetical protein
MGKKKFNVNDKKKLQFYKRLSKQDLKTQKSIIGGSKRITKDIFNMVRKVKKIKLSPKNLKKIKKYKKSIIQMSKSRKNIKNKLSGGFLSTLLPLIATVAAPVLGQIFG